MLWVGALPLMLAMILSYWQGTKSLQGVIGASFKALAYETSTKIDLLIEGEISKNIRHAAHPVLKSAIQDFNQILLALDPETRQKNIQEQGRNPNSARLLFEAETSRVLQSFQKRQTLSAFATRALFITDAFGVLRATVNDFPEFLYTGKPEWEKTLNGGKDFVFIGPVAFNEKTQSFLMTFAFPILDEKEKTIGVLHHVFETKGFFSSYMEPITFGETGHVMLIDSKGMVLDCPILPTGFVLSDPVLVRSVTGESPDWVKTMGDGHGGEELSIIGFSPLQQTRKLITRSEGKTWYTFAWQASDELFAPMQKLFLWISMAGVFSILLIGGMGSLAAKKIVQPIRKLQKAAERIGKGEKVEALDIKTGDELEALANEVNLMNDLLQKSFSGLHDQLAMAEKLSKLGTLTAGIAHELNNPLASIMGFTEAILEEKDPDKIQKHANKVFARAKDMSAIILNMSGYVRSAKSVEEKGVNLNERIDAAIEIAILASYTNDIKLEKQFSKLHLVKAKPGEIQQIFINLLTNAVQAMEGKGKLKISTEMKNGNVLAQIIDTGPGIPKEYLSKIYDPFFTTKEQGKGTGLGLNIVHQLVLKYGGKIDVSSQEGKGTTFSLTFPAEPEQPLGSPSTTSDHES